MFLSLNQSIDDLLADIWYIVLAEFGYCMAQSLLPDPPATAILTILSNLSGGQFEGLEIFYVRDEDEVIEWVSFVSRTKSRFILIFIAVNATCPPPPLSRCLLPGCPWNGCQNASPTPPFDRQSGGTKSWLTSANKSPNNFTDTII